MEERARRAGPRARRHPPGRSEPGPAAAGELDARDAPLPPGSSTAPAARPARSRWASASATRSSTARSTSRGELDQPGEVVPRGLVRVLCDETTAIDRGRERPSRAGGLARLARESADRPRDREPRLAAPVRPRAGADARQLRGRRPAAEPPGAARHAGRGLHGRRLVDQEADPPDRAQPGLRARLGPRSAQLRGRPRQRPRLADEQAPARGRGRARCPAVRRAAGSRPSRRSGRRWRARARGWRLFLRVAGLDASDTHRSVYLPVVRDQVLESLALFDFADPSLVTGERATTTGPAQALYFMNGPFVIRQAEALAERVRAVEGDDARRVDRAYRLAFARPPTDAERDRALAFLREFRRARRWDRPDASGLVGVMPGTLRRRRVPVSGLSRSRCCYSRARIDPMNPARLLASRPC